MIEQYDFDRTIALGERSLGHLKQYRSPAIPRNYEIFYLYSAGYHKELNAAVRKAINEHGRLLDADADRIYQIYIKQPDEAEQLDQVGTLVVQELGELMTAVASAAERTGIYSHSLQGIRAELDKTLRPEQIKTIARQLVDVTNDMAEHNQMLERRLAESKRQIEELHASLEATRAESLTDQLTEMSNRARFDQILEMELQEALDSEEPLCLLLIDIDHFKKFNDTYGHQTGDQVLRLVAHTIRTNIKGRDHAARYGGEEFAVLLPKTPLRAAAIVGEQILNAIRLKELVRKSTGQSLGHITLSIGIAAYHRGEKPETFVHRADDCLYEAKNAGRDRVICEAPRQETPRGGAAFDAA